MSCAPKLTELLRLSWAAKHRFSRLQLRGRPVAYLGIWKGEGAWVHFRCTFSKVIKISAY